MIDLSRSDPIDAPIRPAGGSLTCYGQMYVRNLLNDADSTQRDITESVISCTVKLVTSNDIPWTMSVVLDGNSPVEALTEYLAPVLVVEWRGTDGVLYRVRKQLGLFMVMPPVRDYERNRQTNTYECRDLVWRIAQRVATRRIGIGYGLDCGDAAATLLYGLDPSLRLTIPKTGERTGKIRTIRPGSNLLVPANDLLSAAGYWPLHTDHTGAIGTEESTTLSNSEPHRQILSAAGDLFDTVTLKPDMTNFSNYVFLQSSNSDAVKAAKDGYLAQATDPKDEFSVPNIGPYPHMVADANDISLESIQKRARLLLERKSSVYTRIDLDVVPDPRIRQYSAWELDIKTDDKLTVATRAKWRLLSTEFTWGGNGQLTTQKATLGKLASIGGIT